MKDKINEWKMTPVKGLEKLILLKYSSYTKWSTDGLHSLSKPYGYFS